MKRNVTLKKLGFSSYNDYLLSEHWSSVRKAYHASGRPKVCYVCNGIGEHLHHITYKNLGNEKLDDLIKVCGECHEKIHKLIEERPSVPLALAHMVLKQNKLKAIPKRHEMLVPCACCRKEIVSTKKRFYAELAVMKEMNRPWACKPCRKSVLGIPDVLVRKRTGSYQPIMRAKTIRKFTILEEQHEVA